MRVLVACEYSGRVRESFRKKGHDAWSCDFEPSDDNSPFHIRGDVTPLLDDGWDMLIAHPHCTWATLAGVRWLFHPEDTHLPPMERRRHPNYPDRWQKMEESCAFFNRLKGCNIPKKCIENSRPHPYALALMGPYTQVVQPWMFGEPFTKGACLWLEGLPPLVPTHDKPAKIEAACHSESPGPDRWKRRSRTYQSIADAFAGQWGNI